MVEGSGISGRGVIRFRLSSLSPCGRGWLASPDARRVRGLSPRIKTPHPPSLREGTFSHKGRREESHAFTAAFGQYLSRRCRFTSLPVGVRGSSASKSFFFGYLVDDRCFQYFPIRRSTRSQ